MPYHNLNDETLVMLTLAGEQRAYEVLVSRYQKAVIASAFSVTHNAFLAEDTAQDAFVTAWIKLDTLNEPEKYAAWVCRIAKNCGMNMLRQYRGFLSFDVVENYDIADEDSIDLQYEKEEENADLHKSISRLPAKVKDIIKLHYFEGLSVAGIDRLITMDLHADQIQGFFNIPVDHLYASAVFLPYIQSLNLEELVIATPDVGGSKRASTFSKYLGVPLVLCNKSREKANEVASMQIIGDVKGKNVVLVDDIVDTAGTITKAANIMLEAGAKSVRAIASHCVMSDPASFRIQESGLTEMVFTDSIPYSKKCDKVKQLSIAEMFAETIKRVVNNESISSQYII